MKTFEYTITDELGIHARPAGMLVKEASKFASKIMIASPKTTPTVDSSTISSITAAFSSSLIMALPPYLMTTVFPARRWI